jgi:hypothetical protein
MTIFAIDTDNTITAYLAGEAISEGQARFASEKELAKLAANWPADRLVQLWNSFAGVTPFDDLKPVKKFTDRKTAVARVWKAIQRLNAAPAPQAPNVAPKDNRSRQAAKAEDGAPTAREGSKKALVLEMLRRPEGATLQEIMSATGWMAHSVRGFLSGSLSKKMGLTVESAKSDGGARVYRIAAR